MKQKTSARLPAVQCGALALACQYFSQHFFFIAVVSTLQYRSPPEHPVNLGVHCTVASVRRDTCTADRSCTQSEQTREKGKKARTATWGIGLNY